MPSLTVATLLLAALLASQSGCATVRRWMKGDQGQPDAQMLARTRRPLPLVGVVTLVDEADGFVLIDSGVNPTPATGARLLSYTGAAQSAQLKASVVRRRPFVVADILDGTPRRGDEIFEASTGVAVAVPGNSKFQIPNSKQTKGRKN